MSILNIASFRRHVAFDGDFASPYPHPRSTSAITISEHVERSRAPGRVRLAQEG